MIKMSTSFFIGNIWIFVFSPSPLPLFMKVKWKSKYQKLYLSGRARSLETAGGKEREMTQEGLGFASVT